MKVKRMVKRILALGTGATMLGATMMGALAADLSDYPDPWVTDGSFNGKIIKQNLPFQYKIKIKSQLILKNLKIT
ncbi:MAG: hypothetical protein IH950_16825 [Bacteroidetes bacterium]|nr:hypothetical protein [Bacteroidota bacterium]